MPLHKITPVTVTRDVLTACDPDCRFYPNLAGGVLADASCDARGAGFNNSAGGASFVAGGLQVEIDESAATFLQNGVSWTLPSSLIVPESSDTNITLEWLIVPTSYWDDPGVGVAPSIGVIHLGQSEFSSNYLITARLNPYTGLATFNLAFVGASATVPFVFGQPLHFCIQRPATPSAETPERYFINGVQVLSRDVRTSIANPDTWTLGGFHSSSPAGGILTVLYKEARIATGFTYPHTGESFTPPTRLRPPRLVTGLGDPVVTVGTPILPAEADAATVTTGRAAMWTWGGSGSVKGPLASHIVMQFAEDTPIADDVPDSVSWQIDFPPYPGSAALVPSVTFDATGWTLDVAVETDYRNRAVAASGVWVAKTFFTMPGSTMDDYDTATGTKTLTAAATADCASVAGWIAATLANLGGFFVPGADVCPVDSRPGYVAPVSATPAAGSPVADFRHSAFIGQSADQFTLSITSVGGLPMTLSGVEWTGMFFNNLRRI